MGTSRDLPVGRRQFIAGAGATMLGGCISCPDELTDPWTSATHELCDVHAHFFNMSDLPMRGFITHVLVPNRAPHLVATWDAIGDIADWMKGWSPTVREELRGLHLPIGRIPEREIGSERFSRDLARRINRRAGLSPGSPALADVPIDLSRAAPDSAAGYRALAAVLNGAADGSEKIVRAGGPVSAERIEAILTGTEPLVSSLVEDVEANPCRVERTLCLVDQCDEPPAAPLRMQARQIKTLLKWIWDMMQGRCNHVREYLELTRTRSGEIWRPRIVVNHLVDYDAWLNDRPAPGSSHDEQIDFWTRYAAREAEEVEIITFGGYDPLKHAEQRLRLEEPTFFHRLKEYYRSASGPRIDGFKLYPPMGFKPWGNVHDDYLLPQGGAPTDHPRRRARGIVSRTWAGDPRLAGENIGDEINKSLFEFYEFCIARNAPILAHAIRGNEADCCFGQRANPAHWADLFDREPRFGRLRLCLGHIVADAECFADSVLAMRGPNSPPGPAHIWALHGIARLLQMSMQGRADVYVDIGYLAEILRPTMTASRAFSEHFFAALKRYCEWYDPRCERILFGTDWIVVGWELDYGRYVDLVRHGMAAAGWPGDWQRNFLTDNLKRFLNRS